MPKRRDITAGAQQWRGNLVIILFPKADAIFSSPAQPAGASICIFLRDLKFTIDFPHRSSLSEIKIRVSDFANPSN